jgi:hypothetical protein
VRFNEVPELRHSREYRAACAAYDIFIIRWNVWINNRLRGTVRTGKFFGHGISQQPLIRAAGLTAVLPVRKPTNRSKRSLAPLQMAPVVR